MRQKKFIISGIIVFLALGYLSYTGIQGAATYYYTVAELGQQDNAIYGKNVRVNGVVAPDSVVSEAQGTLLKFNITDADGGQSLPEGTVPAIGRFGAGDT